MGGTSAGSARSRHRNQTARPCSTPTIVNAGQWHARFSCTHLVFWGEASTGRLPSVLRGKLASLAAPVLPALIGRRRLVTEGLRLVSQLLVSYRGSPLSVEGTPRRRSGPRAGDRLPDKTVTSAGRSIPLHQLLARPGVHVLLDRDADRLDTLPLNPLPALHRLTSAPRRRP